MTNLRGAGVFCHASYSSLSRRGRGTSFHKDARAAMIQVDSAEPLISRAASARLRTAVVRPKLRLFCIAQAGCDAGCFHPWQDLLLPGEVEVLPLELPGRGQRFRESPDAFGSIRALVADEILPKISKLLPRTDFDEGARGCPATMEQHHEWTNPPFAIFGHSFGALVAYEICAQIEARARRHDWPWAKPSTLYASGMRAPSLCGPAHDPDVANPTLSTLVDDDAFWTAFERRYGRNPDLAKPEVRAMILPRLRADLAAMETYVRDDGEHPRTSDGDDDGVRSVDLRRGVRRANQPTNPKLTVRTRVICAEGDDRTPRELVEPWADHCEPRTLCAFTTVKGVSPANELKGSGYWGTPHRVVLDYPDELLSFLRADAPTLFRTATLPAESTDPDVNSKEMFAELDRLYGDFTAWDLEYPPVK